VSDTLLNATAAGLPAAAREFAHLTWTVLPYFLIGAAAGAALQAFLPRKWTDRVVGGRGLRPLLMAVVAAALLPGCSCATMPMASGMRDTGAPRLGTTTAFIFMSPLLSPVTVALTWAMLGWRMTAARVLASFAGSILLGLVVDRLEWWFAKDGTSGSECVSIAPPAAGFWPGLWGILRKITPYFLLGMGIAAALSAILPEEAIPRYLGGSSGVWAYLLAALVGIPLYVCEGEEVPITFALPARGLGQGPALTSLLGSVGTCIPTMLMSRNVVGRRTTIIYAVFWILFAIGSGGLYQLVLGEPLER
jgi:uncharacterized membrane protein YraQ (UPF0718 family)